MVFMDWDIICIFRKPFIKLRKSSDRRVMRGCGHWILLRGIRKIVFIENNMP
jgi:hypothetical protein